MRLTDGLLPDLDHLPSPKGLRRVTIMNTVEETGAYRFLHGLALARRGAVLYAAFAYNEGAENTATETLRVKRSLDGGETWLPMEMICGGLDGLAVSHGAFWQRDEALCLLAPAFNGLGKPLYTDKGDRLIRFGGIGMVCFQLNEEDNTWTLLDSVTPDFWPLGPAERTEDGGWVVPGCDGNWLGAVARFRPGARRWLVRHLDTDGHAWTEANLITGGSRVVAIMRNQSKPVNGRLYAPVSVSEDNGETFAPATLSNLPMNASKPCTGRLRDGRPYAVFNYIGRNPMERSRLVLALGEAGGFAFSRFYLLDEDQEEKWLCYPYALEDGDRLLIAYSKQSRGAQKNGEPRQNHNDAVMAMVPLGEEASQ